MLKFLKTADQFIDQFIKNYGDATGNGAPEVVFKDAWKKYVGNECRFRHNTLTSEELRELKQEGGLKYDVEFLVNSLWISLRMAGLTHDIGHLPMSHEFEKVVKSFESLVHYFPQISKSLEQKLSVVERKSWTDAFYSSTREEKDLDRRLNTLSSLLNVPQEKLKALILDREIHELRSLRVVEEIRWTGLPADQNFAVYQRLLLEICFVVLLLCAEKKASLDSIPEGPIKSLFMTLKGIVSSQIDADRLDYVIRDPLASALETGRFDLNRIVRSFTLCRDETDQIVMAPSVKALTAIEAFCHQRYLTYKTLIYHKSSLRQKSVLRQALGLIIVVALNEPNGPIGEICKNYGIISETNGILRLLPCEPKNFREFDDTRLRSAFFDVLNALTKNLGPYPEPYSRAYPLLKTLLETFLFRKKDNVRHVNFEYKTFSEVALTQGGLPEVKKLPLEDFDSFKQAKTNFSTEIFSKFSASGLLGDCVPAVHLPDGKKQMFIAENGKAIAAEKISPYLKMQRDMSAGEARFMAFFAGDALRSSRKADGDEIEKFALGFWSNAKKLVETSIKSHIENAGVVQ